jgi:predicted NACHT family NTPase
MWKSGILFLQYPSKSQEKKLKIVYNFFLHTFKSYVIIWDTVFFADQNKVDSIHHKNYIRYGIFKYNASTVTGKDI